MLSGGSTATAETAPNSTSPGNLRNPTGWNGSHGAAGAATTIKTNAKRERTPDIDVLTYVEKRNHGQASLCWRHERIASNKMRVASIGPISRTQRRMRHARQSLARANSATCP